MLLFNPQRSQCQPADARSQAIFSFFFKDFSAFVLRLLHGHNNSAARQELCKQMIHLPVLDGSSFNRVCNEQVAFRDSDQMSD